MGDIITVIILLAIVSAILLYLWRVKKSGTKCVGCPYARQCQRNCKTHAPARRQKSAQPKKDTASPSDSQKSA